MRTADDTSKRDQGLLQRLLSESSGNRIALEHGSDRRVTASVRRRGRRAVIEAKAYEAHRRNFGDKLHRDRHEFKAAASVGHRRVLQGDVVVLDVETDGLNPYHGARIFCWGYFTNKGEYGFMLKTPENLAWVQRLFNDPTKQLVFHNAKYDLKMFSFEGIDIFGMQAKAHCTMIMSKLYNTNGKQWGHKLENLAPGYLRRTTEDKFEVKDWLKQNARAFMSEHGRKPNFSDAPIPVVRRRCLWDVESTYGLFQFFHPHIVSTCNKLYKTECDLMFAVIDMENTGIQVDISKAQELKDEANIAVKLIQEKLNNLICPFTLQKKKTRKRKGEKFIEIIDVVVDEFNPGSNKHLEAAFAKMGIELKYKTKPKKGKKGKKASGGGNWAFDEYAMTRYANKHIAGIIKDSSEESWTFDRFYKALKDTIVEHELDDSEWIPPLVLKYRELTKMVSTYYNHIIHKSVDVRVENGRTVGTLHCSFNQIEALTGRFSCSNPNLQNIPRILGPRQCFVPRKSRRFWFIDYEQVEMKLFAHFAEDDEMAKAIAGDVHLFVASEIYEVPMDKVTSEQRKRAKAINFGILYGSGPATLAETLTRRGIPTTTKEAMVLLRKYHRRFPSIKRLTNKLKTELARNKFVVNPFGRRYHIDLRKGYIALNYLCQGTSADIMKDAMVKVWTYLRQGGFRSKILMSVHDELCIEVVPAEEHIVLPKIQELMTDRESFYIPITVDAKCAKHRWSHKIKSEEMGFNFSNN